MLGQSKTVHQSEIDAVCELADFWRWNAHFLEQIYAEQPFSPRGQWNRLDHRPLEGFVFAVTPFNFLSIGGNLPTAPVMAGNVALWKPATTQLRGAWEIMALLREAGLPDGVLSFVPGHGAVSNRAQLAAYRDMLVAVGRKVRAAVENGEGLEQVQARHPTAEFDAQFSRPGVDVSPDDFVRNVYEDFTRRK